MVFLLWVSTGYYVYTLQKILNYYVLARYDGLSLLIACATTKAYCKIN